EKTQSGEIGPLLIEYRRLLEGEELTTRVSASQFVLERNQKGKFTLNLKRGSDFSGKVSVKFSVPLASELKLPVEVEFKDVDKGKEQISVEITAGSKPGIHVITIRPTADDPKVTVEPTTVKVTVR